MAAAAPVSVRIIDLPPIAGFVKDVAGAESHFRRLTPSEVASLPAPAARGLLELQHALEKLSAATGGDPA